MDYAKTLKTSVEAFFSRSANEEQLSFLFCNKENIEYILSDNFDPRVRGQFVEFLRQEFLFFDGYTQLDKNLKVVEDFAYAGKDRADIRAVKQYGKDNFEVRVETSKVKQKSVGVGSSEVEAVVLEANRVRKQYLGKEDARVVIGIITSDSGTTKDVDAWFNSVKVVENLHALEVFTHKDIEKWFYACGVHYERQHWNYRVLEEFKSEISYYYHQERLQTRWIPAMVNGSLKLLVVWGCRTGKTLGSIGLMKKYAEEQGIKLRVSIVTAIPSLFKDWEDSIIKVFGKDAVQIHRHRSGKKPAKTDQHLFVLSSAQMLNPEDKEDGVDKETNRAVMYNKPFDILVYDEGHQGLTAENTFKQVVKKIKHTHRIGLTATPFRNGLLNTSIFEDRDVFDYWQQMSMKLAGHPDYQSVPERFLLTVKPSETLIRMFKDFDLLDMGANLSTIYEDPAHMQAAIAMLEEAVFNQNRLLGDSTKHKVKDIIVRANSIEGAKTLLEQLRAYTNKRTGDPLVGHLFGLATGSASDLPGVAVGKDGLSADQFKTAVSAFFDQKLPNVQRKVLIVVDQGIVGHTFETVNTTIDLTTGISLISKYQFWDRGGSRYVYADGYEKNTYYHFDLDPFRLYQMGQEMLNGKRSDRMNTTTDTEFFELLNLFEVKGGVKFDIVNQTAFKEKMDKLYATNKLSQLLPNPASLIVTDGTFGDIEVKKLKNGFGSTGFGDEEHDDDLEKSAASKRKGVTGNTRTAQANLDKSTINAVERVINVLPMIALFEEVESRMNLTSD
jgi:hypothetical protein